MCKSLDVVLIPSASCQGFCPMEEYEEDSQKGATDFKSSEEETGLGKEK
jgi:hypothetical protein